jgi:hypothetical protein
MVLAQLEAGLGGGEGVGESDQPGVEQIPWQMTQIPGYNLSALRLGWRQEDEPVGRSSLSTGGYT